MDLPLLIPVPPSTVRKTIPNEEWAADDDGLSIDSLPLKALLSNTYWKIQPHSFVVVDESLFLQGRESGSRSEYYSAFLEDALLASATRMSTSTGVRRLGPRYVERAKLAITSDHRSLLREMSLSFLTFIHPFARFRAL